MVDHDGYICGLLTASEYSIPRIIFEYFLIVPLAVGYGLQYAHTLTITTTSTAAPTPQNHERKQLPRSYIIYTTLFALFQLCDYLVDDAYGVLFEAQCSDVRYGPVGRLFGVFGLAYVMGFQCVGGVGLMIVSAIRSGRDSSIVGEDRADDYRQERVNGERESQDVNEETPFIARPAATSPPPDPQLEAQTTSENPFAEWNTLPLLFCYTLLTTITILLFPSRLLSDALLLLSILLLLTITTLPFLSPKASYRANIIWSVVLVLVTIPIMNLYAQATTWHEAGWVGLGRSLGLGYLRLISLVLVSLFPPLQFIGLILQLGGRKDTGLSVPSLALILLTQIFVLASMTQRAAKRFGVERQWCTAPENTYHDAPFYCRDGQPWVGGRFWVISAQARMGYSIIVMGGIVGMVWWRRRRVVEDGEDADEA